MKKIHGTRYAYIGSYTPKADALLKQVNEQMKRLDDLRAQVIALNKSK